MFAISLSIRFMGKSNANYESVIRSLIYASDKVRKTGGYTNDIRIGVHENVGVEEF